MQNVRHALSQLGQSLGLPDFSLGTEGHARIRLSNGGAIGFEAIGDELLLTHVTPAPFISPRQLLEALRLADVRQHPVPMPVAIGVTGRGNEASLVVSSRIDASRLGATDLLHALDHLMGWVRQWQAAQT